MDSFFEPNGCYYSNDFEPQGWWVLDKRGGEYYYDLRGFLDGEEEGDDLDDPLQDEDGDCVFKQKQG